MRTARFTYLLTVSQHALRMVRCLPKGGGQNVDRCKNTTLPQLRRGRLIYLPDHSFDKLCDFLTKYSDTGT